MSQIAPLFTQKTVKRRAPESYKVAYKKKKHTVTVSYDYTSWKTDDILLQALARQRQTPPFQNVIGQGPAWPGKEKALALIKAHDKKRDGVVATGAAVAATGSQSALVLGGTATGAVPRLKPPDEAGIVFHPHRLMHESDEESCSSNDSFVRAQRERVAVVRPAIIVEDAQEADADVHDVDASDDEESPDEDQLGFVEFQSSSGKTGKVKKQTLLRHQGNHPWLEIRSDGLRCGLCQWSDSNQIFVQTSFVQLRKLKAALQNHTKSKIHATSVGRAPAAILEHLNTSRTYNTDQLKKIIDSMFFELSHNRPLSHLRPAMQHYAHCMGDSAFMKWMQQDITYLSAQALLQLLHCIGEVLKEDITMHLSNAAFWAVCADGSDDISREHKIAVTVRMVTEQGEVTERFWSMTNLYDRTGRGHAEAVIKELQIDGENKNLKTTFVGCSLDGTTSMSSDNLGAQQRLRARTNCSSLFSWCCAHLLSLASVDSSTAIPVMKQFFQVLRQLWVFFSASQKRLCEIDRAFEELADRCEGPQRSIVEPSETRWLAFTACTDAVRTIYPAIVRALAKLASELSTARFLHVHLMSVQFVASLCLGSDVLSDLSALSLAFQTRDYNIMDCVKGIDLTISSIRSRSNAPHRSLHYSGFLQLYASATGDAYIGRATFDKFHEEVGKPYLAYVVAELERRFASRTFVNSFSIFDVRNHPSDKRLQLTYGDVEVCALCDHYGRESVLSYAEKPVLEERLVPRRRNHESTSRYVEVVYNDDPSTTTKVTKRDVPFLVLTRDDVLREWTGLRQAVSDMSFAARQDAGSKTLFNLANTVTGKLRYPTLRKLMLIGLCLPLVSVECERVFSRLKLIKTSLRNSLSDKSLSAILMMCTCGQETLTADQSTRVLQKFKSLQNRQVDFCDLAAFKGALCDTN